MIFPTKEKKIEHLVVFEDEKTQKVLEDMGFYVEDGKVYNDRGERLKCPYCGKEITVDNTGGIFPGSKIVVCDNTTCILEHLDKVGYLQILDETL